MELREHIKYAHKLVEAARDDGEGKHLEDILDGVDGHLDDIERKLIDQSSEKYVVYGKEDMFISNMCIVKAENEDEAVEKAKNHVGHLLGSRPKAKKVGEHPSYGDVWAWKI